MMNKGKGICNVYTGNKRDLLSLKTKTRKMGISTVEVPLEIEKTKIVVNHHSCESPRKTLDSEDCPDS
jgi:hypothetical protein